MRPFLQLPQEPGSAARRRSEARCRRSKTDADARDQCKIFEVTALVEAGRDETALPASCDPRPSRCCARVQAAAGIPKTCKSVQVRSTTGNGSKGRVCPADRSLAPTPHRHSECESIPRQVHDVSSAADEMLAEPLPIC